MRVKKLKKAILITILPVLAALNAALIYFFYERVVVYKTPFKSQISAYSEEYSLNPFLVYSLIKVESHFKKKAESPKGAKGLMQITDSTADYIASKLNVTEYDLFNVDDNVKFGCYYLRYLLNKFKSRDTALAAYNAGEGNVSYWLKNPEYSVDGINLINVPFKETADYIRKINKSLNKYQKLYGNILDKTLKKK